MPEIEVLEGLGLSEAEAKVYLALIETGSTLAGPIIKKTGLHRGTTYQILQRLKEKGLASSVIKGKKQYFSAAEPERFLDILKEKQRKLQEILPKLKEKSRIGKELQEITVYSGVKGIRSVMDKMLEELNPKGEYYDFGVSGLFKEVMKEYWDLWQKQKKKYKIKSYVIFNAELKKKNPELIKDYYGETRFHPKEYSSITDTIIYKDTVVLFIWTAKPPIAVVIKNKDNAESYKNQFRLMWKYAKK
ncbi:MAG: helix-turn-helix domain-containing protein [Candidatus Nanoarchaeia archaeon]|nr:helix-turn-helix domain-containing protein [Candidatus Nanoarchaeia archaeon]